MTAWTAACIVAVLAVLAQTQAHAIGGRQWPCSAKAEQNSPEVLQLLRKTGNAFKQVGDILLRKTGSSSSQPAGHGYAANTGAVYGVYPPQPVMYYPMAYPAPSPVPHVPQVYPVVPQLQYGQHGSYPVPGHAPGGVPCNHGGQHGHGGQQSYGGQQADQDFHNGLSEQLLSLADEYVEAAKNECGCGNVEVNMRPGPSKTSDIVVEVTLGDLTQAEEEQCESTGDQRKTVNILNVSEASEGEEVDYESSKTSSSSASVEETDETHRIQVVEAIKLQPETSPLQVEVFDNAVAAVEETIRNTVVVKSETEQSKTIETNSGETVINVKTYEESYPKTHEEQISEVCGDDIIDQQAQYGAQQQVQQAQYGAQQQVQQAQYGAQQQVQQTQSAQSYQDKVEVVEVKEQKLEELKKEASVVSEMVETVDIEQHGDRGAQQSRAGRPDSCIDIKVVDVEGRPGQVLEYEYEYYDDDCIEKAAAQAQGQGQSQTQQYNVGQFTQTGVPQYASPSEEQQCNLHEGEHILAAPPRPVESVQVVVQGSSGQAYAEGLQTHTQSQSGSGYANTQYSQDAAVAQQLLQQEQELQQQHYHHHHHANQKPQPPARFDVPCEVYYGLPKPGSRQPQPIQALFNSATKQATSYSAPQSSVQQAYHSAQSQTASSNNANYQSQNTGSQQKYAVQKQEYQYSASAPQQSYAVQGVVPQRSHGYQAQPCQPTPTVCPPTCPKCYGFGCSPASQAVTRSEVNQYSSASSAQPQQQYVKQSTVTRYEGGHQQQYRPTQHAKQQQQQQQSYAVRESNTLQHSFNQKQSNSQQQQQSYAQSQSNSQRQGYSQPRTYFQPQGQHQVQSSSQAEDYSRQQSYSQPQVQSYSQPKLKIQPQSQSYSQPQVQSYSQPKSQSYSQPQVQSYSQPKIQVQPQPQSYSQPQSQSYPQPKSQSYSQPLVQSYSHPQSSLQSSQSQLRTLKQSQSQRSQTSELQHAGSVASAASQQYGAAAGTASQTTYGAPKQSLSSPMKDAKHSPAQYPPYYFSAHADSVFAPPIVRQPVPVPTDDFLVQDDDDDVETAPPQPAVPGSRAAVVAPVAKKESLPPSSRILHVSPTGQKFFAPAEEDDEEDEAVATDEVVVAGPTKIDLIPTAGKASSKLPASFYEVDDDSVNGSHGYQAIARHFRENSKDEKNSGWDGVLDGRKGVNVDQGDEWAGVLNGASVVDETWPSAHSVEGGEVVAVHSEKGLSEEYK